MLDFSRWRTLFIVLPLLLIISTYFVFRVMLDNLPTSLGLFFGYLFYWGFWCLIVPFTLIRPAGMRAMFSRPDADRPDNRPTSLMWVLLAAPVLISAVFILPRMLPGLTVPVVIFSVLFALANGVFQEFLWRGAYVTAFPQSTGLGFLYPAVSFGLFHLSPYAALYGRIDLPGILLAAMGIVFGLCWGWVALRTESIRWTIVSHVVTLLFWLSAAVFFGYDPLG
jgi:uncharacterized protein